MSRYNHDYPTDEAVDAAVAAHDDEFSPGNEQCCEDCRTRYMVPDECGVSYECQESDDCSLKAEAIEEARHD